MYGVERYRGKGYTVFLTGSFHALPRKTSVVGPVNVNTDCVFVGRPVFKAAFLVSTDKLSVESFHDKLWDLEEEADLCRFTAIRYACGILVAYARLI
ncbi:hypothetical protein KIN20_015050 [Parelaphostrongylus tenuis]|uniref:Uncharacterized protein n=1 Tax=Parelaphostrongylus tenuis TaxID=148309 RepID=A0AAD5MEB9_PARTN|nr:hypothetical protein KIN20_015050 [Parelaphostrongylus tenuis]